MDGTVVDNSARQRYELEVGDQVAFADYRRRPGRLVITYVEAPPALRGTGAAGRLMQGVLDIARSEGLKVTPLCPYARVYMERRPEYRDLEG
jgi:predicted GNAT family acetyltransferase